MVEVIVTDDFNDWYQDLTLEEQLPVDRIVDLLGERGVALGMPYSSAINGSKYPLRELRIQVLGRPFRVSTCSTQSAKPCFSSGVTRRAEIASTTR